MISTKMESKWSQTGDMRRNSVLSDYCVRLWAVRAILEIIASPKGSDPIDYESAGNLVLGDSPEASYRLSQRAVDELAYCRPLSCETLSAYTHMLEALRCFSELLEQEEIQFHLFDGFFFSLLEGLKPKREHCVLKLSSFLDKRYESPKKTSKNSVFLFTVPTGEPHDAVLVKADLCKRRFLVYDPVKGRKSNFLAAKIDILRPFLADYLDNFKPSKF